MADSATPVPFRHRATSAVSKDIHLLRERERKAVQSLLQMSQDLGIQVLAEGIEIREELEACIKLGFDLGQGYYLGKPSPDLPTAPLPPTFL